MVLPSIEKIIFFLSKIHPNTNPKGENNVSLTDPLKNCKAINFHSKRHVF